MKIQNAVQIFKEYHKSILKRATIKSYCYVLMFLDALFGEKNIESIKQVRKLYQICYDRK